MSAEALLEILRQEGQRNEPKRPSSAIVPIGGG
jgi:hypothetical protein